MRCQHGIVVQVRYNAFQVVFDLLRSVNLPGDNNVVCFTQHASRNQPITGKKQQTEYRTDCTTSEKDIQQYRPRAIDRANIQMYRRPRVYLVFAATYLSFHHIYVSPSVLSHFENCTSQGAQENKTRVDGILLVTYIKNAKNRFVQAVTSNPRRKHPLDQMIYCTTRTTDGSHDLPLP